MADREYGFRTRAIHAGNIPDPVTGARALPIYQTSAFVFDDTADAAARFALQKYGNVYSRLANPTVAAFEERAQATISSHPPASTAAPSRNST
jgi:O-acetylhomoserine (thiol)-lyase